MDTASILQLFIAIVALVGSLVHLFPRWFTKFVETRLFKVLGIDVTPQRLVGLVGSIAFTIIIYRLLV